VSYPSAEYMELWREQQRVLREQADARHNELLGALARSRPVFTEEELRKMTAEQRWELLVKLTRG